MKRYMMVAALWGLLGPQYQSVAFAQGYPRVVANGENFELDYGPRPGNLVGGGIPAETGQNGVISWAQEPRVQAPPAGLMPVMQGGRNAEIVWMPLPSEPASMLAARPGPRG